MPTAEEQDEILNSVLGAGMLQTLLMLGKHMPLDIHIVFMADGRTASNQIVIKYPTMGGGSAERGYLITVGIPTGEEKLSEAYHAKGKS